MVIPFESFADDFAPKIQEKQKPGKQGEASDCLVKFESSGKGGRSALNNRARRRKMRRRVD
jgi:hypothetical protein